MGLFHSICSKYIKYMIILTKIISAVKEGQQKYCETVYSRSGINHMWILKNSKDLLIFQPCIPPNRMTN
jgi:hypothetical protein